MFGEEPVKVMMLFFFSFSHLYSRPNVKPFNLPLLILQKYEISALCML